MHGLSTALSPLVRRVAAPLGAAFIATITPLFAAERPVAPMAFVLDTGTVTLTLHTRAATVREALAEAGLATKNGFVNLDPSMALTQGITITFRERRPVHIHTHKGPKDGETIADTVGGALWENGLPLGALDQSIPHASAGLRAAKTITYVAVKEIERFEKVPIPFKTVSAENPDMRYGARKVVTPGIEGMREEQVRVRFENGTQVARTVLTRTALKEPLAQEEEVGTKIEIGRIVSGLASWYAFKSCDCAASTIFPRGSFVRVTHPASGKQIIVRINDYGPTALERVIDLDAVVFKKFAPLWRGLTEVMVEQIL